MLKSYSGPIIHLNINEQLDLDWNQDEVEQSFIIQVKAWVVTAALARHFVLL